MEEGKRVLLGFSGGVDSCAAAVLLRERGYTVIPLLLLMSPELTGLCSRAEATASRLGLKLEVEDVTAGFGTGVVDYLRASYIRGETPNPCIRCNAAVKFAGLAAAADRLGIEKLATGHYFRADPETGPGERRLYRRALDAAKDQSYFLFQVARGLLDRTLFPLGTRTKAEAFAIASGAGLKLESYSESQELCFLNGENYRAFLARTGPGGGSGGEIVTRKGTVVGCHRGLENYTVGQRRGLDIAWSEPLYVLELDLAANRLVVGPRSQALGYRCLVGDLNWLVSDPPGGGGRLECQIRHRHRPAPARLARLDDNLVRIEFSEPQFALTPGQGAAFYRNKQLLGGGFIRPDL